MTAIEFEDHVLTTAIKLYLMQDGADLVSIKIGFKEPRDETQLNDYLKERSMKGATQ